MFIIEEEEEEEEEEKEEEEVFKITVSEKQENLEKINDIQL